MGKFKEKNGWKSHFVGIKEKNNVIAATLLLEKNTLLKKSIYYAPRGFLLDYQNQKLLTYFTEQIKVYIKEHNGFFLKIDPYLIHQERDLNGNVIPNGTDNSKLISYLEQLGYHHLGFNLMNENLQPRWLFVLNTKDKTREEIAQHFDSKTKRILKKNHKMQITTREITEKEIPLFKKIMASTSNRREFVDRPLEYYQNMWNEFHDNGNLKIVIAELQVKEYLQELQKEEASYQNELEERVKQKKKDANEEKFAAKQKELKEKLEKTQEKRKEMEELQQKEGDTIPLGGMLFLLYGQEIVYLMGGSLKEYLHFQSAYSIHETMIYYAIDHHFKAYNFYGITGIFHESNPLYGIYFSKKGFGGNVVELIGEFDFIINKSYYYLYKIAFAIYHKGKKILHHIKK